jgi:LysM domain
VTPIKKILMAAAFVAAGYAVASQLGSPQLQIIRRPLPLADRAPAPKAAPEIPDSLPDSSSDARARLVPEVQPPAASADFDRSVENVRDAFDNRSQNEFEMAAVSAPPLAVGPATDSAVKTQFAPRATLRKEAPRPIVMEPRERVTVKDVPQPAAFALNSPPEGTSSGGAENSAPSILMQAQYSQNRAQVGETAPGTDVVADRAAPNAHDTALPPVNNAPDYESRSHIVVDGDSLAKLAQRYLDDPQRANEIYELNRQVLSHPDVLPIGAELMIPSRSASLHSNGQSPQSLLPQAAAIHAASRGGLVPVRPVPPGAALMPRAHLAQPRHVTGTLRVP